jgi:hypothetical protein
MDEQKWMIFIEHYWGTMSYWELIKLFREQALPGAFFSLSALAIRNEFLMRIDHAVHLGEVIAGEYDVGEDAKRTLGEMKALYQKGDTKDRASLDFKDCGIKPFRDKVLAHPLCKIKSVLGKGEYQIALRWETVEWTLGLIRHFADQVEGHHRGLGTWDFSTHKGEMADVQTSFRAVLRAQEDAAKFDALKLAVSLKGGRAAVVRNLQTDEVSVED